MAEKTKEFFEIRGMTVSNVRRIPNTEVITFSLSGKGIGLYGLRIVNGARGQFIAVPQDKGKNGKYYPRYALYLSDGDEERVMKAVIAKLPADEPTGDTL